MRFGLICLTLPAAFLLSVCGTMQEITPLPKASVPAPLPSEPQQEAAPPQLDDSATMLLLRTHLLQLLPCDRGPGQMEVIGLLSGDGALLSVRVGAHTVGPETIRCVLSRVPWWRFPRAGHDRTELNFTVQFPLEPPSINDNVAVLASGSPGRVDLIATTAELRRMRGKLLTCFHDRTTSPLLLLLSLRLGEWGKLLGFSMEADSGNPTRSQQEREHSCLRKVLRYGEFPNPSGGEVEIHFPYVL